MSLRERLESSDTDRRLVAIALVVLLVLVGSGVGTLVLSPFTPPTDDEPTPTPDATPTPTAPGGTATPTPGGGGLPTATDTPAPTATPTATPPSPTEIPTSPPEDPPAPTPEPDEDEGTPTDDPPTDDPPTTPSPGLVLGNDGPLLAVEKLTPGDSGQGTLTIYNAENEDGTLSITAIGVVDEENGLTEPEADVDTTAGVGELSSHLEVRVAIRDAAGNEEYVLGTDSGYVTLSELPSRTPSAEYDLASGEAVQLVADWRLPQSTGNEVQSDGVSVDLGLTLESTDP